MNLLHVLILSLIEGITEFLPVSSTGHLILASHILKIPQTEFLKSFEIIIQLGAIVAVALLSLRTLAPTITEYKKVLYAFIPTSIIGFVLYKFIKTYLLGNDLAVVISLFLGGIILIALELFFKNKTHEIKQIKDITDRKAVTIGLIQALSVIPGVSRAGATIIGAMGLGVKRDTAVAFSFLLAVPTMAAATGLDVMQTRLAFTGEELIYLTVGFIASFIVAYITVLYFLKYIRNHTFIPFGIYRIVDAVFYYLLILPKN